MPANYVGNPSAIESPDPGIAPGQAPTAALPIGTDNVQSSAWYQPVKVALDYVAWLMQVLVGTISAKAIVVDATGNTPSAGAAGTISATGTITSGTSMSTPAITSPSGTTSAQSVQASGTVVSQTAVSRAVWLPARDMLRYDSGGSLNAGWSAAGVQALDAASGAATLECHLKLPFPTGAIGTAPTITAVSVHVYVFGSNPITLQINKLTSEDSATGLTSTVVATFNTGGETLGGAWQILTITGLSLAPDDNTAYYAIIGSGQAGDLVSSLKITYSATVF